ncbi:MAG: sugar phosphate isomerase/epimerase family protein [Hyphomicrobiaceae bacterium]
MKPLPLGINTFSYIYSHNVVDCLRHLGRLGFGAFEILVNCPHFWVTEFTAEERREVPKILHGEGLKIVSVNLPGMDNNVVSSAPEMRAFTVRQWCDLVDLAGEWGISWVIVVPGRISPLLPMPREQIESYWTEGMTVVADRAMAAGTGVLIENVPITWIPRGKDLVAAISMLERNDVGVIYDPANALAAGEDPSVGVRAVKDRLKLVHLSDTPADGWKHDPIGSGDIDFTAFNAALREIGYEGLSMLELITATPDRDVPESLEKLKALGWVIRNDIG